MFLDFGRRIAASWVTAAKDGNKTTWWTDLLSSISTCRTKCTPSYTKDSPSRTRFASMYARQSGWVMSPVPITRRPFLRAVCTIVSKFSVLETAMEYGEWMCKSASHESMAKLAREGIKRLWGLLDKISLQKDALIFGSSSRFHARTCPSKLE